MRLSYLLVLLLAVVAVYCVWRKAKNPDPILEHMGGYGTISGLYYNNNAKYCFKNIYDPPDYPGYCSVIGTVSR